MRSLILIVVGFLSATSQAGLNIYTLSEKTVEMEVTGAKVTSLGYGALTPKILIPEMAKHTALNHRNFGEEAPCLAGEEEIIIVDPIVVPVDIKRELHMDLSGAAGDNLCGVTLVEIVNATVKGKEFFHILRTPMPQRELADCVLR